LLYLILIFTAIIALLVIIFIRLQFKGRITAANEKKHLRKAAAYFEQGLFRQGISLLMRINQQTRSRKSHEKLISAYLHKKAYPLALMEIKRYLNFFLEHMNEGEKKRWYYHYAETLEKAEHFQEAVNVYMKIRKDEPREELNIYKKVGFCLYRINNLVRANEFFNKAYAIDSNDPQVLRYLGIIYYEQQDFSRARDFLQQAAQKNRKDFLVQYYLGMIQYQNRKFNEALTTLNIVRRDPENRLKAIHAMGKCYQETGQKADALEIMESALPEIKKETDWTLNFRYDLAAVYEDKKEYQNALDQWHIISAVDGNYKDVSEKLYKNARYGHDRIADFKVLSQSEFETYCRKMLPYFNFKYRKKHGSASDHADYEVKQNRKKTLVRFYRGTMPVGKRLMQEFQNLLDKNNFNYGIIISASGVTPNAGQYILDKDIQVFGIRQLMRALKKYEKKFTK